MRKRHVEELAATFDERLADVRSEVGHIREEVVRKLERLDAWLITRDPSTRVAAEAYDGLRKQVSAGAKARRMHLVDLAKLDLLVRTFESRVANDSTFTAQQLVDSLAAHGREWSADAGLSAIDSLSNDTIGYFEIVDEPTDGPPNSGQVLNPAYVDRSDGNPILIRRGTARLVHNPSLAGSAASETATRQPDDGITPAEQATADAASADENASGTPANSEAKPVDAAQQRSTSSGEERL